MKIIDPFKTITPEALKVIALLKDLNEKYITFSITLDHKTEVTFIHSDDGRTQFGKFHSRSFVMGHKLYNKPMFYEHFRGLNETN